MGLQTLWVVLLLCKDKPFANPRVRVLRGYPDFLSGIFSGVAKSIVVQISFVMLPFLLLWDQISGEGGQKSPRGGQTSSGGAHCPSVEES